MLEKGQTVEINYAGQLEDGYEFVNTWLMPDAVKVTIGASGLLPAIEQELITMTRGERRTIEIPCADAYGEYDPTSLIAVPTATFPHAEDLPVGAYIEFNMAGGRGRARVLEMNDETILFDCNHELAGHNLRFEVELVDDGTGKAMDQELDATGCGCNKLREALSDDCCCDHHHHS